VQARAAELRKAKTVIADGLLHAMLGAGIVVKALNKA